MHVIWRLGKYRAKLSTPGFEELQSTSNFNISNFHPLSLEMNKIEDLSGAQKQV